MVLYLTASRQLDMYQSSNLFMYLLMVVALAIFAKGVYDRYRFWQLGVPEDRLKHGKRGLIRFFLQTFGHLRILRDTYPGVMHWFFFWSFAAFTLGTLSIAVTTDLNIPLFQGAYYLLLSLIMDLLGLGAMIAIGMALWRRYGNKPEGIDNTPDDLISLLLIGAIFVTGFLLEGLRIALPAIPGWSGTLSAQLLPPYFPVQMQQVCVQLTALSGGFTCC